MIDLSWGRGCRLLLGVTMVDLLWNQVSRQLFVVMMVDPSLRIESRELFRVTIVDHSWSGGFRQLFGVAMVDLLWSQGSRKLFVVMMVDPSWSRESRQLFGVTMGDWLCSVSMHCLVYWHHLYMFVLTVGMVFADIITTSSWRAGREVVNRELGLRIEEKEGDMRRGEGEGEQCVKSSHPPTSKNGQICLSSVGVL